MFLAVKWWVKLPRLCQKGLEKSVCDALRYRNKIGIDVSSEILRNYLSRKERNITRLTSYAKSMWIAGILNNYVEIQL